MTMDVFLISLAALLFGGLMVLAADMLRHIERTTRNQINNDAQMRHYRKMFE